MSKRRRSNKKKVRETTPLKPPEQAPAPVPDPWPKRRVGPIAIVAVVAVVAAASLFWLLRGRGPLPVDSHANVLLITLDTTRADRIGAYGYDAIETPNLDSLAADGVLFTQAISSIPLTLPAHASLLTGAHPPRHGVRDNGGYFLDDRWTTLAEAVRERGHGTFAAVGAFVLHELWGLSQGFDVYDDEFGAADAKPHEMLRVQRDGAEVVEQALAWMDERGDKPFLAWLHFYDPHYPYEPPGEFAERYADRPYDGEIAYTDQLLGRVLDYLREKGLYDSTLIVVIGDHGEGLDEHREPDHGIFLYDSTLRVPLIVRAPQAAYRGVVEEVVRDVDVMPTVLEYLEVAAPDEVEGMSLLGLMAGRQEDEPRYAYSESRYCRLHYGWSDLVSIRDSRYKFIEAPTPELYDLQEDPGELRNIYDRYLDVATSLRERLAELSAEGVADSDSAMEDLDPDTLEKLRSLGYVGSLAPEIDGELPDPKDRLEEMNLLIRASRESAELLGSGQFEEVASMLEEVLSREPNYMDGYLNLAAAYMALERADEAIEVLDGALKKTPESVNMMQALAKAHMDTGDNETAEALFRAIIVRSPRYAQAYYGLSKVQVERGEYDEAVLTLQRLLDTHPGTAMAAFEMGMAHVRAGRPDAAQQALARALELSPRLANAHFNLALIAEERGDAAAARKEYELELEVYPGNSEAGSNLGLLCAGAGDLECAERAFSGVIEHNPEFAVAHYFLARTQLERGRLDQEVLKLARRAVELDPSLERARVLADQIERALAQGAAGS
jgi:arylsulfatase A-like enzyme/Flp pilus assembly protein TadD